MAFQARWRELKKAGWHSRKPTGLCVDFTCLKLGKTERDTRGEDNFMGAGELMKYLVKFDIDEEGVMRGLNKSHQTSVGKATCGKQPVQDKRW
ncbi:hypothetical protein PR003_g21806 [Phytophthora rubi]|uniref:Uncharacterized protein n=1 Tax=Phytophthora rubi TaxID=129364 RepID=A0A6A3JCB0_9STRA|nr:hypothetical protein PR002_g21515 [Phytophthora rubi]KAE8996886.1 hypothetical protein PR001_g19731 [Phytophthora rubi]KAE9304203.1 hypothetical protein PR003_g21806 [Phytophthora rubi]